MVRVHEHHVCLCRNGGVVLVPEWGRGACAGMEVWCLCRNEGMVLVHTHHVGLSQMKWICGCSQAVAQSG